MINADDILNASILIVDDQEANVQLLKQMLREIGYQCTTSTMDPHAVCALHRENRYDLILLDLQMPGMDGFQVMEGLKEIETDDYLPVWRSRPAEPQAAGITASVGVGIYPTHGEELEMLMKSADLALCEAKRTSKNDYRIAAHRAVAMAGVT